MFVASAGSDTITDFISADTLNLQAFMAFASFADVQAALTPQGADTLLELGNGNPILTQNTTVAQFNRDIDDWTMHNGQQASTTYQGSPIQPNWHVASH